MKWSFIWIAIFSVSWSIGAIVCGVAYWRKNYQFAKNAALVFFCWPAVLLLANYLRQHFLVSDFEYAKTEVTRLCAIDGGDKIYKTVDNVQGIFQMRARKPNSYRHADGSFYNAMADQYGMEDPYGVAQEDHDDMRNYVGWSSIHPDAPPIGKQGYWFIEQQPEYGSPKDSEYRRNYLAILEKPEAWQVEASKGSPLYEVKKFRVSQLKSRYGYFTEDLTTKEMRNHWIGAGRIKIIDLQTNEVLAERKGYFRADGDHLPADADRWTAVGAYMQKRICPSNNHLQNFLQSVLKPPQDFPTPEQLELIAKD
jgi:hypothetical protein